MSSMNKEARARARVAGHDSRLVRRGQILEGPESLGKEFGFILNLTRSYCKVLKQKMSRSDQVFKRLWLPCRKQTERAGVVAVGAS